MKVKGAIIFNHTVKMMSDAVSRRNIHWSPTRRVVGQIKHFAQNGLRFSLVDMKVGLVTAQPEHPK